MGRWKSPQSLIFHTIFPFRFLAGAFLSSLHLPVSGSTILFRVVPKASFRTNFNSNVFLCCLVLSLYFTWPNHCNVLLSVILTNSEFQILLKIFISVSIPLYFPSIVYLQMFYIHFSSHTTFTTANPILLNFKHKRWDS
jgi:hypothetical protein